MAYIDTNKITIPKGFFEGLNVPKLLEWLNSQPTADVVPKSEVVVLEREIARLKKSTLPSYCQAVSEEEAIKIGKQYGRAEVATKTIVKAEHYIKQRKEYAENQLSKAQQGELFLGANSYYNGRIDSYSECLDMLAEIKKEYGVN